jgi:hypothetical protein
MAMKTAWFALPALVAAAAPALAMPVQGGERFAAVTIVAGEGVRANVANVLDLVGAPAVPVCPVTVTFFAGDGTPIGSPQSLSLQEGESASVPASSPPPGLVRAVVSISDASQAKFCALKNALEIFDAKTGATKLVVPSDICVGLGECAEPLK